MKFFDTSVQRDLSKLRYKVEVFSLLFFRGLTYIWSRANTPLTNESHTLEDRGRRLLVNVGQNHTDKYNCTVSGPLGVASKDLVLSLRELKPSEYITLNHTLTFS